MSEPHVYTKEQDEIRKGLREDIERVRSQAKIAQESQDCDKPQAACEYAPNPHQLIQDRIDYHNKTVVGLWALYRALPRELPRGAADALAQLILDARPRY